MVQNKGIDELRVEKVMELVHITATKNFVTRNISIMVLGGIHERTPTLTSRGFIEEDFMKNPWDSLDLIPLPTSANFSGDAEEMG
ncbi:hypothetical protein Peur_032015 [Populus x canadensis]